MSKIFSLCLFLIQICTPCGWAQEGMRNSMEGEEFTLKESYTQFVWQRPLSLETYSFAVKAEVASRTPASTVPQDDFMPAPAENKIWLSKVFVEDNAGVMHNMRDQLQAWQRMEEYRRNWDIESTGLYDTPDSGTKVNWFNKMLLRYADKRLSGEMKSAEAGSTLRRINTVQQALRPDTEAQVSQNIKLKFKARVIQMRAVMQVINPWVDAEAQVSVKGELISNITKDFKDLGVRANLNYSAHEGIYTASFSKPLGNNVTAIVSSSQSDSELAFADLERNTVQFVYTTPF